MGTLTEEGLDCRNCKYKVSLLPGNMEAMELINQAAYGLISEGRVDYRAMEIVFDINNVPDEKRRDIFEKFLVYIRLQMDHMKKEMDRITHKPGLNPGGMRT